MLTIKDRKDSDSDTLVTVHITIHVKGVAFFFISNYFKLDFHTDMKYLNGRHIILKKTVWL